MLLSFHIVRNTVIHSTVSSFHFSSQDRIFQGTSVLSFTPHLFLIPWFLELRKIKRPSSGIYWLATMNSSQISFLWHHGRLPTFGLRYLVFNINLEENDSQLKPGSYCELNHRLQLWSYWRLQIWDVILQVCFWSQILFVVCKHHAWLILALSIGGQSANVSGFMAAVMKVFCIPLIFLTRWWEIFLSGGKSRACSDVAIFAVRLLQCCFARFPRVCKLEGAPKVFNNTTLLPPLLHPRVLNRFYGDNCLTWDLLVREPQRLMFASTYIDQVTVFFCVWERPCIFFLGFQSSDFKLKYCLNEKIQLRFNKRWSNNYFAEAVPNFVVDDEVT